MLSECGLGSCTPAFVHTDGTALGQIVVAYASLSKSTFTRSHSQDFFQFDSLTQTSTGLNVAEAEAFNSVNSPEDYVPLKALPVQALDHAAGQLLALGINAALARTYTVSLRSIPSLRYRLLAVDCTILILPNRITLLFIHTTAHLVLEFLGRWLL